MLTFCYKGILLSSFQVWNTHVAVILGGVAIQPLIGYILQVFWVGEMSHGVPVYPLHAYQMGLLSIPICFAIAVLTAMFLIRETHCIKKYAD